MKKIIACLALFFQVSSVNGQISLTSVVSQLKKTYDKIKTFKADLWIGEYVGWTNSINESIGRYYYKTPVHTRLEVGSVNNYDSSVIWTVYKGPSSDCSSDLANHLLIDPIVSSANLDTWISDSTSIVSDSDDSCVVKVLKDYYYSYYTVDKKRWVITRYLPNLTYKGTIFLYENHQDSILSIKRIAFADDTTMGRGGIIFNNVVINGAIEDSLVPVRHFVNKNKTLIRNSVSLIQNNFNMVGVQNRKGIFNLSGRLIPQNTLQCKNKGLPRK